MKLDRGHLGRLALTLPVALIVCLVFAATAFGAVGFGTPIPAEGATVAAPVDLSIKAADAASELRAPMCNIVVRDSGNNVVVGLNAAVLGSDGVLSLSGADLAAGMYTATATVADTKLKTYSKQWAFTVDTTGSNDPLVLLDGYPKGTIYGATAEIGVTFAGTAPVSATFKVNGTVFNSPTIDDTNNVIYLAAGVVALEAGQYDIVVEAAGEMLNFSFVVAAAAEAGNCMTCHADIMEYHTFISAGQPKGGCVPCHGPGAPFGLGDLTDGGNSPHGDKTGGCINADCHAGVADPKHNDALAFTCTVCHFEPAAEVHHSLALLDEEDCGSCHSDIGTLEGTSACTKCHTGSSADIHHSISLDDEYCGGCHDDIGSPAGKTGCDSCHAEAVAEPLDYHHAVEDAASKCADCHTAVVEEGTPVRRTGALLLFRALMTHLVAPTTAGTGDVWLDNGNVATRKSECTDCHNIAATTAGDPLAGVTTYVPKYGPAKGNWASFDDAADFTEVVMGNDSDVADEYLCMKCHAGPASASGTAKRLDTTWTTAPALTVTPSIGDNHTYIRGDIAREFNPENASGHRIFPDADGVFRGRVQVVWQDVVGVRGFASPVTNTTNTNVSNRATAAYLNSGFVPAEYVGTNVGSAKNIETQTFSEVRLPIYSLTSWFRGTDSNGQPWAYNSQMTCTDCHTALASNNEATGPHGANIKFGLDPDYPRDWKFLNPQQMQASNANHSMANETICAKCHDLNAVFTGRTDSGGTSTNAARIHGSNHNGRSLGCVSCHLAIPHGGARPRLLAEFDRDLPAYTAQQYGTAVSRQARNWFNLTALTTATVANGGTHTYTPAQLTTTYYGWNSSGVNCVRGCDTHGSLTTTNWFWE